MSMASIVKNRNIDPHVLEHVRSRKAIGLDKDGVIVDISELIFQNRLRGFNSVGLDFHYSPKTTYLLGGLDERYNGGTRPIEVLMAFDRWHEANGRNGLSRDAALQKMLRDGDVAQIERIVAAHLGPHDAQTARRIYWWDGGRFFASKGAAQFVKPRDGARQAVLELGDMYDGRIAIVTNAHSDAAVTRDLAVAGFTGAEIAGLKIVYDAKKPSPEGLERAFGGFGVSASDAAYVGDATIDVRAAKSYGATSISVLGGMGTYKALLEEGTDMIVAGVQELSVMLRA